jgi:hypothetical protein
VILRHLQDVLADDVIMTCNVSKLGATALCYGAVLCGWQKL